MITQPNDGRLITLASILIPEDRVEAAETIIRSTGTDPNEYYDRGLFVCLADTAKEAFASIEKGLRHGAVVALVRTGVLSATQIADYAGLVFETDEPRDLYGRACQKLLDNPASRLKLIAITGTSGKTSLSYIVAGMLAEAGYPVGLVGSLGIYDGKTLAGGTETTPTADRLASTLASMVANGCTHAIIEVSSVGLAEHRIAGLTFDAVCLTNIRRDHLDIHGSLERYRKTKMSIFDYTNAQTLVVCNGDDRVTEAVLHLINCPTITVGIHPAENLVRGMLVEQNLGGQTFYIVAGNDAVPLHTKIVGTEHIYNCLLAAGLGICWGIDLHTIVPGIERVEHVPGRLEQIDCGQPFTVFVDNAGTQETLEATLRTARSVSTGKLYCVLGIPLTGDRSRRPILGQTADNMSDLVVVTAGDFSAPASEQLLAEVTRGMESPRPGVRTNPVRKDAIAWALADASPNDTVVIVGSDPVTDDATPENVSSRQFVRAWLYENQPSLEPFWF